jgi:hypothetical protein
MNLSAGTSRTEIPVILAVILVFWRIGDAGEFRNRRRRKYSQPSSRY